MSKNTQTGPGYRNDRYFKGETYGKQTKPTRNLAQPDEVVSFELSADLADTLYLIVSACFQTNHTVMFSKVFNGAALRVTVFHDEGNPVIEAYDRESLERQARRLCELLGVDY